jgi:hypothetical protein
MAPPLSSIRELLSAAEPSASESAHGLLWIIKTVDHYGSWIIIIMDHGLSWIITADFTEYFLWILGSGLWNCRFWMMDSGFWIVDYESWIVDRGWMRQADPDNLHYRKQGANLNHTTLSGQLLGRRAVIRIRRAGPDMLHCSHQEEARCKPSHPLRGSVGPACGRRDEAAAWQARPV